MLKLSSWEAMGKAVEDRHSGDYPLDKAGLTLQLGFSA